MIPALDFETPDPHLLLSIDPKLSYLICVFVAIYANNASFLDLIKSSFLLSSEVK